VISPNTTKSGISESAVLAELVDRLTRQHQAGQPIDWNGVLRQYPEHAEELHRLLPALKALDDLSRSGVGPLGASATDGGVEGVLGDFRIIREIGRGGMGVVYEAEQISLRRPVALKVLPFAGMIDPRHLQRFQNEAQAAACLHHSNIAPVYFVGSERGVHFYAMQLIEGQTLAAIIRHLSRPPNPTATPVAASGLRAGSAQEPSTEPQATGDGQRTSPYTPNPLMPLPPATTAAQAVSTTMTVRGREYFRTVARLGAQAAEALDYAHQMGVVHRDIKPANVILDIRGTLWIMDFGLAQFKRGEIGLTMTGDIIGTLRYMSPEQALAKRVPIDHRTDIYSLGATLYELLALRPAIVGDDRQELLRQIAFEEPPPPRRVNKAVPAELETIVLKAMEKNPFERYATAKELADDLDRFLKDEPIRAKRPTLVQRVGKWSRRHQPVVTTAALALLVAVVGLAVAVFLLWQERDRTREANRRLKDNLRLSLKALDEIHVQVTSIRLHHDPERKQEDLELLKRTLVFYEQFAEQNSDDPEVRHETAKAYRKVADIRRLLGEKSAAEEAYRRSIALLEELAEKNPAEPAYAADLGWSLIELGLLWMEAGRYPDSEQSYRRARSLFQQLADEYPDEPQYRWGLAQSHNDLGQIFQLFTGRLEEAEEEERQARRLREKLAADDPDNATYQSALADSLCILGDCLRHTGRPLEAQQELRHALTIREALVNRWPKVPLYVDRLVSTYKSLGKALYERDQFREAEQAYRKAIDIGDYLIKVVPNVLEYQENLAANYYDLSTLLRQSGREPEAEAALGRCLKIRERFGAEFARDPVNRRERAASLNEGALLKTTALRVQEKAHRDALQIDELLVKQFPSVPAFREDLAGDYNNLGSVLLKLGQTRDAEANLRQSRDIRDKLVHDFPTVPDYRRALGLTLQNQAAACRHRNDWGEARRLLEEAVRQETEALERNSLNPSYRNALRDQYGDLATTLDHLGNKKEALEVIAEMRATFARLANKASGNPSCRRALAETHLNAAYVLEKLGRQEDTEAAYREAIADLKKLAEAEKDEPRHRYYLARGQQDLAVLLVDRGKETEAEALFRAAFDQYKKLADEFPGDPWYLAELASARHNLGIVLTDLAKLAEAEKELLAAQEIQEELVAKIEKHLGHAHYRECLGASHNGLGLLYRARGELPKAEAAHRDAVADLKKLSADFPDNPDYRAELGDSYCNLATVLNMLAKPQPAEAAFREAIGLHEAVVKEFPEDRDHRRRLAISYNNLATLQQALHKWAECEESFRKALDVRKKLADEFPGSPDCQHDVAAGHHNLGLLFLNQQKWDPAGKELRDAQGVLEKLVKEQPDVPTYAVELAGTYSCLAKHAAYTDQPLGTSLKWFDKGVDALKPVLAHEPKMNTARQNARTIYWGRAEILNRLNRHRDALADLEHAIEYDDGSRALPLRLQRATTLAILNEHVRACAEAAALATNKAFSESSGQELYELAAVYSLSVAAAKKEADLADRYASRAVALLRQAAGQGFKDVEALKKSPEFAPLQPYAAFQKLLKELDPDSDR
jgi:serine/threonine protein kinase